MRAAQIRKLLRVARTERRELARLRPAVGARRAVAARVREQLDLHDATPEVARLEAAVQLLTGELVGAQECLARLEVRITDLTGAADREAARIQRLEDAVAADSVAETVAAIVDPLREAGIAREVLATTTWIGALPPSDALVSIVMPTHNRPQLLAEAIESVLQQGHENFELLVVDDASGPETAALLAAVEDPRVRSFRREQNGGGGAARNIGLAHARGEYITYLDDDNLIGRLWLRGLIWAFENDPACEVVYGAMSTDWALNPDRMPFLALHVWDRQQLLLRNFVDQGMIAHRASLATAVYDEAAPEAGDWDFMVRATRDRDPIRLPVVAVHYRTRHDGRISDERDMRTHVALTHQRLSRRGPLRVLVLDTGTATEGASPTAVAEQLARLGDQIVWGRDAVTTGGAGDLGLEAIEDAIRAVRPELVLVSADPAVEAELLRLHTAYVAFAAGGTGERPVGNGPTVSLGRWDSRAPFGSVVDGPALRTALLRELDMMHAAWRQSADPGPLSGDAVLPVVDTRHEPGLVTVIRDAVAAAAPAPLAAG